jgi:hypothetical protein
MKFVMDLIDNIINDLEILENLKNETDISKKQSVLNYIFITKPKLLKTWITLLYIMN